MKKRLTILLVMVVMMISNVCMATGDGIELKKQQKIVEKFTAVLNNTADDSDFAELSKYFAPELQDKMSMANLDKLRQDIRSRFGVLQEAKFVAYERFDQGDRITYLANYTRQDVVRLLYGFDKKGKLREFVFVPLSEQK